MARVKKRKPYYEAFQWGVDYSFEFGNVGIINSCLAQYSSGRIEEGWWGKNTGHLSVWSEKKHDYVDFCIDPKDWVVIRSDGKVKVLDSDQFSSKFEEDK